MAHWHSTPETAELAAEYVNLPWGEEGTVVEGKGIARSVMMRQMTGVCVREPGRRDCPARYWGHESSRRNAF